MHEACQLEKTYISQLQLPASAEFAGAMRRKLGDFTELPR